MTEQEWQECTSARAMLEFLDTRATRRKLRLFACAFLRSRTRTADDSELDRVAWEMTTRFAEGLVNWREVQRAWWKTAKANAFTMLSACTELSARSLTYVADALQSASVSEGGTDWATQQPVLLRHIIGNPFRPYAAPPSWPAPVVKLAEAMYAGEDCSFALHDALLEAGHPELAEHFREKEHPKGCWVVDVILGKA
jgi:hypothetical protein